MSSFEARSSTYSWGLPIIWRLFSFSLIFYYNRSHRLTLCCLFSRVNAHRLFINIPFLWNTILLIITFNIAIDIAIFRLISLSWNRLLCEPLSIILLPNSWALSLSSLLFLCVIIMLCYTGKHGHVLLCHPSFSWKMAIHYLQWSHLGFIAIIIISLHRECYCTFW